MGHVFEALPDSAGGLRQVLEEVDRTSVWQRLMAGLCNAWQVVNSPKGAVWLLLGVFLWLGIFGWLRPLHIPDEGRYVGVAWDMVRFDSTWTPLLNGLPYFHKPPLFYWLNEFSFLVFGANEWAARVPSILVAWLTVAALYLFVRRHRGTEVATVATIALVTMPYFYGASQYANLDMLVAAMICLTIMAGAEAVSRRVNDEPYAKGFAIAAGVFAALAVLSKGLIGVVLPGGVLFFWLLATRRWQGFAVLLGPGVWVGFALVSVPWFVAMELQHPGFLHYFFVYQHFERYLTTGFNQQKPLWFFLPVVFGMSLPWSAWLLRYIWRPGSVRGQASWFWLMSLWMVVIIVFFSIPDSKLIGYTVPVLAPLAVLIAEAIVAGMKGDHPKRVLHWFGVSFVAAVSACLLALVVFLFANDRSSKPFAQAFVSQMSDQDQYVVLDPYPFDLAFYTRNPNPSWVVFNWPALAKGDTWRNELAEAGEFAPDRAKDVLITPEQFLPRVCAAIDRTYWIVAYPHEKDRFPFLVNLSPVHEKPYGVDIWKLNVNPEFRRQWCQETPREQSSQS